jgi:hypothetical protein
MTDLENGYYSVVRPLPACPAAHSCATPYPPTRAFPAPLRELAFRGSFFRVDLCQRLAPAGRSESCGVIFPMSRNMIEAQIHGGKGKKEIRKRSNFTHRQRP